MRTEHVPDEFWGGKVPGKMMVFQQPTSELDNINDPEEWKKKFLEQSKKYLEDIRPTPLVTLPEMKVECKLEGPYGIDKGPNDPNELDGWFAQINKKGEVICNWNMKSPDYPTPPYAGTIYDADGAKVHCPSPYQPERAGCPHYIFWANLTTGEVRCRSFNPDGSYAESEGRLAFITRWLKAPLRYKPPHETM